MLLICSFMMILLCAQVVQRLSYSLYKYQTISRIKLNQSRLWRTSFVINAQQQAESSSTTSTNNNSNKYVNLFPDLKKRTNDLASKMDTIFSQKIIDLNSLRNMVKDLEEESSQQEFWENQEKAQEILAELARAKDSIARSEKWIRTRDDIETLLELYYAEPDESLLIEASDLLEVLESDFNGFEIQRLLSGKYDNCGCVLSIQSGAGGTEATDWTAMLYRMYTRYAEKKGFRVTIVDLGVADHGYKNVEVNIEGPYAYGLLAGEKGTHRLVRISPFNAQGKRQTTFAAVETWPILEDKQVNTIEIPEKDLEIAFMRSGGSGGQNVNKVETAVRIKHLPTGIAVKSTIGRTQSQNREDALNKLKAKLIAVQQDQALKDLQEIKGDQVEATFGQQIRNYVFAPYKLVKDVRTGQETSQVQDVMDGAIDEFINSYLRYSATGEKKQSTQSYDIPE